MIISPTFALKAHTLLEGGQPVEAISLCEQGLELYPDYATAYTVLAKAYRLTGDIRAAVGSIERGLMRLPLDRGLLRLHSEMQSPADEQQQPGEQPVPEEQPDQPEVLDEQPSLPDEQTEQPEISDEQTDQPGVPEEQPELPKEEPEIPEEQPELPEEPAKPEIELPETEPDEKPEIQFPEPHKPETEPHTPEPEIEIPEKEEPEFPDPSPDKPEIEPGQPEKPGKPEIELPEPEKPEIIEPKPSEIEPVQPEQPEIELPEPEKPEIIEPRPSEIEPAQPEQPEIELPATGTPGQTPSMVQAEEPRLFAAELNGAKGLHLAAGSQSNGHAAPQRHTHLRVIESAGEPSDMPSLIWRSRNVRLIPGLEFTPLRFESKKDKIYRRTYRIPDPPPFPDFPVEKKKAVRFQSEEHKNGLTPLEELARRLEAARIPRVEEDEVHHAIPAPEPAQEAERRPAMVSETIAKIYEMQGATLEAIRAYEALARQKPEQAETYLKKARELKNRS